MSEEKSSVGGLRMIAAMTGFWHAGFEHSVLFFQFNVVKFSAPALDQASSFHGKRYAIPWTIPS
jgi:hypothetical protein